MNPQYLFKGLCSASEKNETTVLVEVLCSAALILALQSLSAAEIYNRIYIYGNVQFIHIDLENILCYILRMKTSL